ncbi:MAG: ATP-dependent Clp protease proteolytic subunit [Fimbriimonadaceae bacterium]|uniref:Periplasmic serine protease n=1 Tax=Candidatus Nitrosymbiomonas proteolyticus TaxID=2608984 RepID=A0A809S281_9BACT|nr:MAG: Periplasmic serine protease (ClpP class) [Armatimonadetes bacterium OLB18]WKZ81361.1 MAG: ATP-dependent Clp protease proteolytic subunit [Fimbriimonadaceae bacterium]BBO22586.1 periplasmic serine protease [Candidatus Nitrosymbiomonas proteolyticus]
MPLTDRLDETILSILNGAAEKLETKLDANVMTYLGPIHEVFLNEFRNFVEHLAQSKKPRLAMLIKTGGGSAQAAEKMVEIMRHHYKEVWFVVPDFAMSAGTILVLSGDKVWMDYSSSLGPVDPQVLVTIQGNQQYVPALGHLDKVAELIEKSRQGTLTNAEFAILRDQNLAVLRSYEQARDLSINLLEEWLVKFKFKTWAKHRTDPAKVGKKVTDDEKKARAKEIAALLCDNKVWHSHGRLIGHDRLRDVVRLEIDDYSADLEMRALIREYHDPLNEYAARMGQQFCLHSKNRSTL